MREAIDLTGQSFGRLTAVKPDGRIGASIAWLCLCSCGNNCHKTSYILRHGLTKNCGCRTPEEIARHKKIKTPGSRFSLRDEVCYQCGKLARRKTKPAIRYFCSSACYRACLKENPSFNPNYRGATRMKPCEVCKKEMRVEANQLRRGEGRYCSVACSAVGRRGRRVIGKAQDRVNRNMRRAVLYSLRRGEKKRRPWHSIVGYTSNDLRAHLESLFRDGMSWDNYGVHGWHIDHIIPVTAFSFETVDDPQFAICWALSNLQPLWAKDNIRKGGVRGTKSKP